MHGQKTPDVTCCTAGNKQVVHQHQLQHTLPDSVLQLQGCPRPSHPSHPPCRGGLG